MANREWQAGDRVFCYNTIGNFTHESKVLKVYKNGNFTVEFENALGEKYGVQFSGKHSDGFWAQSTGDGWRHMSVRFVTPELEAKQAEWNERRAVKKLRADVSEALRLKDSMTRDQLDRVMAIINETSS